MTEWFDDEAGQDPAQWETCPHGRYFEDPCQNCDDEIAAETGEDAVEKP